MRTITHVIDTQAVKATINAIPPHWVVRGLSERDYGIDLMIEIFTPAGRDGDGNEQFEETGYVCYLQIKGTGKDVKLNTDGSISLSIDKKSLRYMERFSTPFLLVRTVVYKAKEEVYFVWVQRYISDVLDFKSTGWRTGKTKSITIHIPAKNVFSKQYQKIEEIARWNKYLSEQIEFRERFQRVIDHYDSIEATKGKSITPMFKEIGRIKQLRTLLVDSGMLVKLSTIEGLEMHIHEMLKNHHLQPLSTFPDYRELVALMDDHEKRIDMENDAAKADDRTVY